jgi:hypothetical protein
MVNRSGSYCCGCYIVDHYCLRFDREVVCIVAAGYIVDHFCLMLSRGVVHIVDHYCLMFDRGVVHIVVAAYIFVHYVLMFDRGMVHIVVAGYNTNYSSVKPQTVMVNNITATTI